MAIGANLVPGSQNDGSQSGANVKPIELTDATFIDLTKNGLVFVDFWAEWCGPCMMVAPLIDKLAEKWQGKIKFAKLNTDDHPATPGRFGILSIPTFYMFYNGQKVDELVGAGPEQVFETFLKQNFDKYVGSAEASQPESVAKSEIAEEDPDQAMKMASGN